MPHHHHLDQQLTGLAALADPLRRALYHHVADRGQPVSRHHAAATLGADLATQTTAHPTPTAAAPTRPWLLRRVDSRQLSGPSGLPRAGRPWR